MYILISKLHIALIETSMHVNLKLALTPVSNTRTSVKFRYMHFSVNYGCTHPTLAIIEVANSDASVIALKYNCRCMLNLRKSVEVSINDIESILDISLRL